MPDPVPQLFSNNANNQAWLNDMQGYFAPNKTSGRTGPESMPDRNSSAYDMGGVQNDTIRRLLIALFGGDELAANKYLRGEDPSGMIKYGGDRLPPLPRLAGGRPRTDPLLEEARGLAGGS